MYINQRHKPIQYRACVVDLLGLGIILYYTIVFCCGIHVYEEYCFTNDLVSYINIHVLYPLLSQHVHFVRLSLYHAWCVSVFPSLSYTNMHTPSCFCFGMNVYCLPTKYENLICYKVCILLLNQVSISELHEHAYSHCFFIGVRKGYCLPTSDQNFGVVSLMFYTSKHLCKRVT